MTRSPWSALLLAPTLLCAAAAHADEAPAPAPPAAPAAESAPVQPVADTSTDVIQQLRDEIARVRREAKEERDRQEARIRALEQKLQDSQKAAPAPNTPNTPTTNPGQTTAPGAGTAKPDTSATGAPAPPGNPVTSRPGFRTRIYGFLRADMDQDNRKMFAGDELPFYVLSPADPRGRNKKDGDFTIHPRLTRVGIDTEAPAIKGWDNTKVSGKLEIDFFNMLPDRNSATSNSRQFLRIRHAYGQLDHKDAHFLFGQTWDLISPLFPSVNYEVLMWNAGNLGDRRPQFRFTYDPKVWKGRASLAVMAGSSGAIDGQDIDADQNLDGEESGRPVFQFRAALNQRSWVKGQNWEFGLWGHDGAFRIDRAKAIAGHRSFSSQALGLDLRLPITRRLLLQGEAFVGQDMADIRGGVGQNLNAITGGNVRSHGGWAEVLYQATPFYTVGGGFTIDDPENRDVTPFVPASSNQTSVGRTLNRAYYLVNHFNLGGGFLMGADVMFFHTDYRGLPSGSNTRFNFWLQHNF